MVLVGAALVALGRDRPEQAALLLGAADAIREHRHGRVGAAQVEADPAADAAGAGWTPTPRSRRAAGRALATDDALREVIASAGAGGDHRQDGQTR